MFKAMLVPFLVWASLIVPVSAEGQDDEPHRSEFWQRYAAKKFVRLNQETNGRLGGLFRFFGGVASLETFFDEQNHPENYDVFQEFLIEVFENCTTGDVVEAMFANLVMRFTPAEVTLDAIGPELGGGGRLEGLLERPGSDVAKYLQRQNPQAPAGSANFDHYVRYLKGGRDKGLSKKPNADLLVCHMFETAPHRAILAMLWADYGFLPYAEANCYVFCGDSTNDVRSLQVAEREMSDYVFRVRYSFPVTEEEKRQVHSHLHNLSRHQKWWVRLYVAEVLRQHAELCTAEVIDPLKADQHELVRRAIVDIDKSK